MALSKGDEFPLHQTAEPIAQAGTDRNFYDRYFFNGYAPDGSGFFAAAMGIYPQLGIIDAHFNVIRDGVQHCIHASRTLDGERLDLTCGAISLEIVEPLQRLVLRVADFEGICAEIHFTGRAFPIEEPRFTHRIGPRAFMDYTRMTQNGHYTGWIEVDGERKALAEGTAGTRDRSWGVRPVGARDPQPIPGHEVPSFFWQWTPINFADGSLFFHNNADTQGEPWNSRAAWAADGADARAIREGSGQMETQLEPATRWPKSADLALDLEGAPKKLSFETLGRFQMRGLGYTHPKWGHGMYHGGAVQEREDIDLKALDPLAPENLHVQFPVAVTAGEKRGIGVIEQLIIGPYAPFGLSEFLDGAAS